MPKFRHKRTGRVVTVDERDAHRYRGSNFEPVPDDASGSAAGGVSTEYVAKLDAVADVPVGTAAEILSWVGDDEERRVAALDAEYAGKNRKTLIAKLGG